jgi:hypothetical protein
MDSFYLGLLHTSVEIWAVTTKALLAIQLETTDKRSRYGISTNLAGNTVKLFLDKESFKGFHDDARFLKASDETYWMLLPLRLSKEREGRSAIQLVSSFCMPFLILNRFL